MVEFEKAWDWYCLAKHFDLKVTDEESNRFKKKAKEKGLIINDPKNHDVELAKIGVPFFSYCDSVEDALLQQKLRDYIHENIIRPREWDNEDAQAVRDFVKQLSDQQISKYDIFWKHLLKIEDDYIFFKVVADNLGHLWN